MRPITIRNQLGFVLKIELIRISTEQWLVILKAVKFAKTFAI